VIGALGAVATASADPTTGSGAMSDGATGKRGTATMSAAPGGPVQLDDRPRPAIGHEVRRSNDHHTAYLGAAAVVLGAMVWWNRRRRERFEREDRGIAEVRDVHAAHDDDADELRAAARGDAPDAPRAAAGDAPERRASSARPQARAARRARETR
jgi:hypothetical protein